jgi:hypothetical protein
VCTRLVGTPHQWAYTAPSRSGRSASTAVLGYGTPATTCGSLLPPSCWHSADGLADALNSAVGTPTLTTSKGSNPRARTRLYRVGVCVSQDFPVADISEHLEDPGSVVWLDLCRPTTADFSLAGTEFGLHELAVEDALHESQRPPRTRRRRVCLVHCHLLPADHRPRAGDHARASVWFGSSARAYTGPLDWAALLALCPRPRQPHKGLARGGV